MWANVLQYVDDDGVPVGELAERARTSRLSLAGLKRWRYITLDPDSGTGRTGSAGIKVQRRDRGAPHRGRPQGRGDMASAGG